MHTHIHMHTHTHLHAHTHTRTPQVLSVYETGLPHCLDPHTLETLGLEDFNGALRVKALAAHFRLDMKNKVSATHTP